MPYQRPFQNGMRSAHYNAGMPLAGQTRPEVAFEGETYMQNEKKHYPRFALVCDGERR